MSRAGEICLKSGTYRVVHDTAHRYPHAIDMVKGHLFLPCGKPGCGVTYTLLSSNEPAVRTSEAASQNPIRQAGRDAAPHREPLAPAAAPEPALFRFTGANGKQYACARSGDGWAIQSQDEFIDANGGATTAARLWMALPCVPKPMEDYPRLAAAVAKIHEYVELERPVRSKIATYKKQGVFADEAELLGTVADAYARIVSMHLAEAVKLFRARQHPAKLASVGGF